MPTYSQNNTALLHRKEFQMMTPVPVTTAAGMYMVADQTGNANESLYMINSTTHYIYYHNEDAFTQISSGALGGTFTQGSCGVRMPWSDIYVTTTGGTNTVITNIGTYNIIGLARGKTLEFIGGTNNGTRVTISELLNNAGSGNVTLTVNSSIAPVAVGDKFRISTGKFFILNGGTIGATSFKSFDLATLSWTTLSSANLSATWATEGAMASAARIDTTYLTGTATSGNSTTLVNSSKNWATNALANYQVRITSGTGRGQIRHIISNNATNLTVSMSAGALSLMTRNNNVVSAFVAGDAPNLRIGRGISVTSASDSSFNGTFEITGITQWTGTAVRLTWNQVSGNQTSVQTATSQDVWITAPDNTSVYSIEGSDEYLFLAGNAAVLLYKYSVLLNTWVTMGPAAVRAAAPGVASSLGHCGVTGDTGWASEGNLLDGRYLFGLRGGAVAAIDRYDIALNRWLAVNIPGTNETFTTGASTQMPAGKWLYIAKEGSASIPQRILKYNVRGNYLEPVCTDLYLGGAALAGNKIWVKNLDSSGSVRWLYLIQSTSTVMKRLMLF